MNKFNLTFSGEILPGENPDTVKLRFAEMFSIDTPERLERFFSGEPVVLRRNMERKAAAECYQALRTIGVAAALVKVTAAEAAEAVLTPKPKSKTKPKPKTQPKAEAASEKSAEPAPKPKPQPKPPTKAKTQRSGDKEKTTKRNSRHRGKSRKKKTATGAQTRVHREEEQLLLPLEAPAQVEPAKPVTKKKEPLKRVKSTLELPQRPQPSTDSKAETDNPPPVRQKRQPGEPNFYQLTPFRNTSTVKARSDSSARRARRDTWTGLLALVASLVAALLLGALPAPKDDDAIVAAAASAQGQLMITTTERVALHDRAGVESTQLPLSQLGVSALTTPQVFSASGELLTLGATLNNPDQRELLRCDLTLVQCTPITTDFDASAIVAIAENTIDGSLFFLVDAPRRLLQTDSAGTVLRTAPLAFPDGANLHRADGLLLINSGQAPAIDVHRYDVNAFGKQLDQILLLPPAAMETGQTQAARFTRAGDTWWAVLRNPDTGGEGLYHFDAQWNYLGEAPLPETGTGATLIAWGNKLLVNDGKSLALQRFSVTGQREVPFTPEGLVAVNASAKSDLALRRSLLQTTLGGTLLLALFCLLSAHHQRIRALVYGPRRERGAPPLDETPGGTTWVDPATTRSARITRLGLCYVLFAMVCVSFAVSTGTDARTLAALLIALVGPLTAWRLIHGAPPGNIGVQDGMLILADHTGLYQRGSGSQITYHGSFLVMDDVVVHRGGKWLPAFDLQQAQALVGPLARAAVRIDRKTLWIKLVEGGHPFARSAIICASCAGIALALWLTR